MDKSLVPHKNELIYRKTSDESRTEVGVNLHVLQSYDGDGFLQCSWTFLTLDQSGQPDHLDRLPYLDRFLLFLYFGLYLVLFPFLDRRRLLQSAAVGRPDERLDPRQLDLVERQLPL